MLCGNSMESNHCRQTISKQISMKACHLNIHQATATFDGLKKTLLKVIYKYLSS